MATRARQFGFLLAGLRDKDNSGVPLNGGKVKFFATGTSNAKNVWTEVDKTNAYTEYTLDTNGIAELYGDGNYKVEVYDSSDSLQYTYDVVKVQSGEFLIRTVTSASVSVDADDDAIIGDTGSNSITLNLDPVANFSKPIFIKKDSASNTLTIDPDGSEQVDGDSTYSLTEDGESIMLLPDTSGDRWLKANDRATGIANDTLTFDDTFDLVCGTTAGVSLLRAMAASLGATEVLNFLLGKNTDNYNAAYFGFYNQAGGNQNNELRLGMLGTGNVVRINAYGNVGIGGAPEGSGGDVLKVTGDSEFTGDIELGGVINSLDVGSSTTKRVGPKGSAATNSNGNPNISDTLFDLDAVWNPSSWVSIGPTGSGADQTWTALDSVPADADYIIVRIDGKATESGGTPGDLLELDLHARDGGSSQTYGVDNKIYSLGGVVEANGKTIAKCVTEARIAVDSDIVFDVIPRDNISDFSSYVVYLVLVGWDFDPPS